MRMQARPRIQSRKAMRCLAAFATAAPYHRRRTDSRLRRAHVSFLTPPGWVTSTAEESLRRIRLRYVGFVQVNSALPHHSSKGTRRTGVELLGNAAGEERLPPRLDGVAHGFGHPNAILRI